jgi:hypothetical protein
MDDQLGCFGMTRICCTVSSRTMVPVGPATAATMTTCGGLGFRARHQDDGKKQLLQHRQIQI